MRDWSRGGTNSATRAENSAGIAGVSAPTTSEESANTGTAENCQGSTTAIADAVAEASRERGADHGTQAEQQPGEAAHLGTKPELARDEIDPEHGVRDESRTVCGKGQTAQDERQRERGRRCERNTRRPQGQAAVPASPRDSRRQGATEAQAEPSQGRRE
jgi:hypothetical protein